ncbi:MAG: hypothetical protein ACT4OZ_09660 [Gemmatimonadota bacterium]
MIRTLLLGAALGLSAMNAAGAQGALSNQGFGYPLGGLSARALGSGGASGELDPRSSRNPAAVWGWIRSGIYIQYDPEVRRVTRGDFTDNTFTPRFAAVGLAFPFRERGMISVSSHSFLDRTWTTEIRSGQILGPDSIGFEERVASSGAINDTRLAFAWGTARLVVGAGLHIFSGENRLNLRRQFDDTLRYRTLRRDLTLAYSGTGISVGVVANPARWISLGASLRRGGNLDLHVLDTLRSSAGVPDRLGFSTRVEPLTGLSLYGSADRTLWSDMEGLGSISSTGVDSWEYGIGAEFAGTTARTVGWAYSAGFRTRDLPFEAAGSVVKERLLTAGVSVPLAGPRATIDLALQRATRSATDVTRERAWLMSFGLTVRP